MASSLYITCKIDVYCWILLPTLYWYLVNYTNWRPCLWMNASYQVSVYLAKRFHRRTCIRDPSIPGLPKVIFKFHFYILFISWRMNALFKFSFTLWEFKSCPIIISVSNNIYIKICLKMSLKIYWIQLLSPV
jgi:hypothetical protein